MENVLSNIKVISHETKLRDFQYKINNTILVTNSFLYKINKIDNLACSYCGEQPIKFIIYFFDAQEQKHFGLNLKHGWQQISI